MERLIRQELEQIPKETDYEEYLIRAVILLQEQPQAELESLLQVVENRDSTLLLVTALLDVKNDWNTLLKLGCEILPGFSPCIPVENVVAKAIESSTVEAQLEVFSKLLSLQTNNSLILLGKWLGCLSRECASSYSSFIESLSNFCVAELLGPNDSHHQLILDTIFPPLCSRFPRYLSQDLVNVWKTWASSTSSYGLLVCFFAACGENEIAINSLLLPIIHHEDFEEWLLVGFDRRFSSSKVEKQSVYILKTVLDLLEVKDPRFGWLCIVLHSLDYCEMHHIKHAWPRVSSLLVVSEQEEEQLPLAWKFSWAQLVFIKALRHSNLAVKKFVISHFLENCESFLNGEYLNLTPQFVFDVLLPGIRIRELYRVCLIDDDTLKSGSLFRIEDIIPRFIRRWFLLNCSDEPVEPLKQLYRLVVAKTNVLGHSSYLCMLFDVMCSVGEDYNNRWMGNVELSLLRDLLAELSVTLNNFDTRRRFHYVYKKCPELIQLYLNPSEIDLSLLCRTFIPIAKVMQIPDSIKIFFSSSTVLKSQASQLCLADDTEFNDPETVACAYLLFSKDRDTLGACLVSTFSDFLNTIYVSAYRSNTIRTRRLCLILHYLFNIKDDDFQKVLALEFPKIDLSSLLDWCYQYIEKKQETLLDVYIYGANKNELSMKVDMDSFLVSQLSNQNVVGNLSYCLKALDCCRVVVDLQQTENIAALSAFVSRVVSLVLQSCVSNSLETYTQAVVLIDRVGPWISLLQSRELVHELMLSVLLVENVSTLLMGNSSLPKSQVVGDCDVFRLRACLNICPLIDNAGIKRKIVKLCVGRLDMLDDGAVKLCLKLLQLALQGVSPETIDHIEVQNACWAAYLSSTNNKADIALEMVSCVFQPSLVSDAAYVESLLKPFWHKFVSQSKLPGLAKEALARNVVLRIFAVETSAQSLALWCDELLDLLLDCGRVPLTTIQCGEFLSPEIRKSFVSKFEYVNNTWVHPHSFTRCCVMYLFEKCLWIDENGDDLDKEEVLKYILGRLVVSLKTLTEKRGNKGFYVAQALCLLTTRVHLLDLETQRWFTTELVGVFESNIVSRVRYYVEIALIHVLSVYEEGVDIFLRSMNDQENNRQILISSYFHVLVFLTHIWQDQRDVVFRICAEVVPYVSQSFVCVRMMSSWILRLCVARYQDEFYRSVLQGVITADDASWEKFYNKADEMVMDFVIHRRDWFTEWLKDTPMNSYGEFQSGSFASRFENAVNYLKRDVENRNIAYKPKEDLEELLGEQQIQDVDLGDEDEAPEAQEKINPWKDNLMSISPHEDRTISRVNYMDATANSSSLEKQLIVVTSLLNEVSSIGSLVRTSEIFAASKLVVANIRVTEKTLFKRLAVSATDWLTLVEVKKAKLVDYLLTLRGEENFHIVGLEQTFAKEDATLLSEYCFPRNKNIVLVFGDEMYGIPVPILHLCDDIVAIPKGGGVTTTLLAHIAGALTIWEVTKQTKLSGSS